MSDNKRSRLRFAAKIEALERKAEGGPAIPPPSLEEPAPKRKPGRPRKDRSAQAQAPTATEAA